MLDQDGGGTIEADEFIGALSRWVHDSKTAPRFVKHAISKLTVDQKQLQDNLQYRLDKLDSQLSSMCDSSVTSPLQSATSKITDAALLDVLEETSRVAGERLRKSILGAAEGAVCDSLVDLDKSLMSISRAAKQDLAPLSGGAEGTKKPRKLILRSSSYESSTGRPSATGMPGSPSWARDLFQRNLSPFDSLSALLRPASTSNPSSPKSNNSALPQQKSSGSPCVSECNVSHDSPRSSVASHKSAEESNIRV
eukprot:TRINITY_DN63437_c0_g1_i1.p1 TRINITY_DN63437_c0_g1~~TRINITY_DN63437_c0_g1_i1.p1  ORF type:complete len:262 (+),score=39.39 TRINITY_DN63437_c0_g1_i1:31-786(+)